MKILQIASRFPYPPDDGGRIGIWNITRQFVEQGHQVWLVTFWEDGVTKEHISYLQSYVTKFTVLPKLQFPLWRYILSTFDRVPVHIRKRKGKWLEKIAKKLQKEAAEYDVIHADGTGMIFFASLLGKSTGKPVGVRMHNVEWVIWHRYSQRYPQWHPANWYLRRQAKLLRKWEGLLLQDVDIIFPITEPDAQRISEFGIQKPMVVVPAGVDPYYWQRDPGAQRQYEHGILAANFEWKPNLEGMQWFLKSVYPHTSHSLVFHICGKKSEQIRTLHTPLSSQIHIHGYVPDIRLLMSRCGFLFAPLRTGGGMRIKILEAMAMELPVVTTTVGAEGIEVGENEGLFRVDDPKVFADILSFLARSPDEVEKLGRRAREFVMEEYTWEKQVRILLKSYEQLIESSSSTVPTHRHLTNSRN